MAGRPPAVLLLQSRLREGDRVLELDRDSRIALIRWLSRPDDNPRPASLAAAWVGTAGGRRSGFPSWNLVGIVLPPAVLAELGAELREAGHLIPLTAVDEGGTDSTSYQVYVAGTVADCLDEAGSSEPDPLSGYRRTVAFHADRLPDAPAFRVPQIPELTYWSRDTAERIAELTAPDAEPVVVWSLDPDLPVHPNPMATRM